MIDLYRRNFMAVALGVIGAATMVAGVRGEVVDPPVNSLTPLQEANGWRLLFDGENPEADWRGYNSEEFPGGWQAIEDGWLALEQSGAGDIITRDQFDNFELFLEWKVAEGSNSGIFYLAQETGGPIWHSAPEYQVLDGTPNPVQASGSLYDLIGSSVWAEVIRETGEVNTTRIVKNGDYVEHHMNGRLLFSFEIGADEWDEMVEASKFNAPPFASTPGGHIGLQDHGDWVGYRNIMIRELDAE